MSTCGANSRFLKANESTWFPPCTTRSPYQTSISLPLSWVDCSARRMQEAVEIRQVVQGVCENVCQLNAKFDLHIVEVGDSDQGSQSLPSCPGFTKLPRNRRVCMNSPRQMLIMNEFCVHTLLDRRFGIDLPDMNRLGMVRIAYA